jgi:phytoene dehydrogenase-like protein
MLDAVVVGSGPNGLTAAITLAEAGARVVVLEAAPSIGGGAHSEEFAPGAIRDVCSSVHPLAAASPAFTGMSLADHGLRWLHSDVVLAHPLDGGDGGVLMRDLDATCGRLEEDGPAWRDTVGAIAARWDRFLAVALAPPSYGVRRPLSSMWFARRALASGHWLARRFRTTPGRALIGGLAAHGAVPLDTVATGGTALVLGAAAHTVGWPFAASGSSAITAALASRLRSLGGDITTDRPVHRWDDLPGARLVILTTAPAATARIAGERIGRRLRSRLAWWRHGPGVFKVDAVVDGPVPWEFGPCTRAGTVHVGGSFEEIADAEAAVARGEVPDRPFVIAAQPTTADPSRAPEGNHVLWAYCHVPSGSTVDMRDRVVSQLERFAPGIGDRIVHLHATGPADFEAMNPNLVGGDITGGALSWRGLFARPRLLRPYRLAPGIYLASTSTPPGPGVHGMSGYHAARAALRELSRSPTGGGRAAGGWRREAG